MGDSCVSEDKVGRSMYERRRSNDKSYDNPPGVGSLVFISEFNSEISRLAFDNRRWKFKNSTISYVLIFSRFPRSHGRTKQITVITPVRIQYIYIYKIYSTTGMINDTQTRRNEIGADKQPGDHDG